MLELQNFACGACEEPFDMDDAGSGGRRMGNYPRVDHDHRCCPGNRSCGKCVRGLLCYGCNVAAGLLGDDSDQVLKLAAYLIERNA